MRFLANGKEIVLDVDGTKAVDNSVELIRWSLDDAKNGRVSLAMDCALTETELDILPFCLMYEGGNRIMPRFKKEVQKDARIAWDDMIIAREASRFDPTFMMDDLKFMEQANAAKI